MPPGLAQLDENPKNDVARYGLAIAQIKGAQFNLARENLKPLLAKAPNDTHQPPGMANSVPDFPAAGQLEIRKRTG